MFVTPDDVAEIVRLGTSRAPAEACGILLTRADGGPRIAEVPNRAAEPYHDVLMSHEDLQKALLEVVGDPARYPGNLTRELVVWHTHPGGLVGPSKVDMEFRRKLGDTRCLVVTIPSGEAVQF
jgi:proteasome lid subunit RPN8/RPN11